MPLPALRVRRLLSIPLPVPTRPSNVSCSSSVGELVREDERFPTTTQLYQTFCAKAQDVFTFFGKPRVALHFLCKSLGSGRISAAKPSFQEALHRVGTRRSGG